MKRNTIAKRLTATALSLVLLPALAACGGQNTKAEEGPSETLQGIYEALTAPDSDYSENKAMFAEYYPELEYRSPSGPTGTSILPMVPGISCRMGTG